MQLQPISQVFQIVSNTYIEELEKKYTTERPLKQDTATGGVGKSADAAFLDFSYDSSEIWNVGREQRRMGVEERTEKKREERDR